MPVTLTEHTRRILDLTGGWIRLYRGDCPETFIAALMASEVGSAWTRAGCFAVSNDKVIIELDESQEPITVFHAENLAPFSWQGGTWLRCHRSHEDARWLRGLRAQCPKCGHVQTSTIQRGEWECLNHDEPVHFSSGWPVLFPSLNADLWFCVLLRYSVGKGALRHVLDAVQMWRACRVRKGQKIGTVTADIGRWANGTDLSLPPHVKYWGRQSPAKIVERLSGKKHLRRIAVAEQLGVIEGANYQPGREPPETRPSGCAPFPAALVRSAVISANPLSTAAEHAAAWQVVKDYARRERRVAGDVRSVARKFAEAVGLVTVGRTEPRPEDDVA
jgi:hypothetical protein